MDPTMMEQDDAPVAEAPQSYVDEEKKNQLEKDINAFCESAANKRRPKEIVWALARRMVQGDQWVRKNPLLGADKLIEEVQLPGRMEKWKITVNRLLPGMDTRIAHVLKNKPIGVVMPETQDEEDRNAARVADEVVEYDLRTLDYHAKMAERAAPETFSTGVTFWHWYWDPMAGPPVQLEKFLTDPMTGEPVLGPDQKPVPDPEAPSVPRGEPALEVVEAEELYLDPGSKTFDDSQMVVRQTLRPVAEVKSLLEAMGVNPEEIEKVDAVSKNSEWGSAATAAAKLSGYSDTDLASRCEVRVCWAKPNPDKGFPEGLRAVMVNRKLYSAEPTPPGSDHIPFAMMGERFLPGEMYPTSSVIQAMPIQKALNLTISRDEYRRTVQRPKLVADHEAGLDPEAFTNEDSEMVLKNHGYTVDWLGAPTYESDPRAADRYIQLIDDIFGNVAILMGESDGEVRSGRQAFIQGEYAGTALSGPARSIERCVQKVGSGILKLRKANTDESRDIQIVGKNRSIEVLQFRGADLEGAGDYYVEPGSALPMSPQAKKQMILDLVDRKILDPMRALKLLPMPSDIDAEMDDERLDRDRATEENMLFQAITKDSLAEANAAAQEESLLKPQDPVLGQTPLDGILEKLSLEPRPDFENNQVHLDQHNKFRKSRAYRQMPKAIQGLFDHHCEKHLPPPPMAPGEDGPGGGGGGIPPDAQGDALPQGLMPGMPPRVGNGGELADVSGDMAAQMPPMPPTPGAQVQG